MHFFVSSSLMASLSLRNMLVTVASQYFALSSVGGASSERLGEAVIGNAAIANAAAADISRKRFTTQNRTRPHIWKASLVDKTTHERAADG
jgi:hypothetical protein